MHARLYLMNRDVPGLRKHAADACVLRSVKACVGFPSLLQLKSTL